MGASGPATSKGRKVLRSLFPGTGFAQLRMAWGGWGLEGQADTNQEFSGSYLVKNLLLSTECHRLHLSLPLFRNNTFPVLSNRIRPKTKSCALLLIIILIYICNLGSKYQEGGEPEREPHSALDRMTIFPT